MKKQQKDTVPEFLFLSAMGFYDVARNCAYNIKKDTKITGFQRIAPAAVNFCFAAELLLKGLNLLTNRKQINGHSLLMLFLKLPEAIKIQVELRYKYHQLEGKSSDNLGSYKMRISSVNSDQKFESLEFIPLNQLLKSHDKGFENWRYIYEIKDGGYVYDIDFKSLDYFVKALIDTINSIPKKQRLFMTEE